MASHQCPTRTSPTRATNCGLNILWMSRVTSPSPPSPPFNRHLMVRSSIVKTSRPHLYGSIVLVSTTRPLTIPSRIRPSLNLFLKIQRRLSRPLSTSFNNKTANHTHVQLAPDDNSQQGTFWPNERRGSKVVDPSSPLLILPSNLCSTSWPEWSFNSSQWLVQTTSPLVMSLHFLRSFDLHQLTPIGQSRSSWILHQHWPRTLHWSLVHALRLPPAQNGRLRPWGLLSLSWKIQQSGWHHQGSHISST